jgi:hypothetical protein
VAEDGEEEAVLVMETLRLSVVVAVPKPKRPQPRRDGADSADAGVEVPQPDLQPRHNIRSHQSRRSIE